MASYFMLLLCISLAVVTASGKACGPCIFFCVNPDTLNCPYGKVRNPCTCCYECLKGEGEECGGPNNKFGTCAKGLICRGGHGNEKPGHCKAQGPIGR